ncbi:hypothetical protein [Peribacillus sp. SCS-155]|uniref:hypothetical protein n=1 Tax=Peribacillus sedimenti TaxID=3115297 RepID=UPI0039064B02
MSPSRLQMLIETEAALRLILKEEELSVEMAEAYQFVIGHLKLSTMEFTNAQPAH